MTIDGDGPWAGRPLRVADRVVALIGGGGRDPLLETAAAPLRAGPLPQRHAELVARAVRLLVAVADGGGPRALALAGDPTAPLHAVAAAIAAQLGREAWQLDPQRLAATHDAARILDREAALTGLAYVIDDPADDWWRALRSVVVLAGREPPAGGVAARIDVPAPTYAERRELLRTALADGGAPAVDAATVARTAAQFPLAPDALAGAVRTAVADAGATTTRCQTRCGVRVAARRGATPRAWPRRSSRGARGTTSCCPNAWPPACASSSPRSPAPASSTTTGASARALGRGHGHHGAVRRRRAAPARRWPPRSSPASWGSTC